MKHSQQNGHINDGMTMEYQTLTMDGDALTTIKTKKWTSAGSDMYLTVDRWFVKMTEMQQRIENSAEAQTSRWRTGLKICRDVIEKFATNGQTLERDERRKL